MARSKRYYKQKEKIRQLKRNLESPPNTKSPFRPDEISKSEPIQEIEKRNKIVKTNAGTEQPKSGPKLEPEIERRNKLVKKNAKKTKQPQPAKPRKKFPMQKSQPKESPKELPKEPILKKTKPEPKIIPTLPEPTPMEKIIQKSIKIGQLITKTKISRQKIKYYLKFDLLPYPLTAYGEKAGDIFSDDVFWNKKCISKITEIQIQEALNIPINKIRINLGPEIFVKSDDDISIYRAKKEKPSTPTPKTKPKPTPKPEKIGMKGTIGRRNQVSNTKRADWFFRQFDPLKPIKNTNERVDCVLHLPVHLEDNSRDSDSHGSLEDFITHRRCVKYISEQKISDNKNFKLHLIISINGDIMTPNFVSYFRSIHETQLSDKVFCKVYQRPNIGYQWGGFHDVWLRYKEVPSCNWFVTLEGDHKFMEDLWFDKVTAILNKKDTYGGFGKHQRERHIPPGNIMNVKVPGNAWRTGDGSIKGNVNKKDIFHTCGALHFVKREVLQKMDDAFGCFSFATGCNHTVDGIIQGEIAFCQKVKALGYEIRSADLPAIVRALRGADCLPNEWDIITEEMAVWRKK